MNDAFERVPPSSAASHFEALTTAVFVFGPARVLAFAIDDVPDQISRLGVAAQESLVCASYLVLTRGLRFVLRVRRSTVS